MNSYPKVVFGALVDEFIGALQHGQDTSEDIAAKVQHLTLFLVYIGMNGEAPFSICA